MYNDRSHIKLGILMILISFSLYAVQFALFRDTRHIIIVFIDTIASVFLYVFLVTLFVDRLLNERDKRATLEKLNMVIGVFYTEVGTSLLDQFCHWSPNIDNIRGDLCIATNWTDKEFSKAAAQLKKMDYSVNVNRDDIASLRTFMNGKRDFLLRLLENPVLLEHETFTELLRAVFHLTEELATRVDVSALPDSDIHHIAFDIRRAFSHIATEWLSYMKHTKENYPYLFSLAVRTDPFDPNASPIIKQ